MNILFDRIGRIPRLMRNGAPLIILCISVALQAQPSLRITSPTDGTVFNPGQTIPVMVNAAPATFQTVIVAGDLPLGFSQILTAPPYQFQMPIPSNINAGPYTLTAIGITQQGGNAVYSDPVTVPIERPDSPQSLNTDLSLTFEYIGDSVALAVTGSFADGSTVSLTRSTLTTYISDNPLVATVDANGVVTAVGPGSCNLRISNAGASTTVPVSVPPPVTVLPDPLLLNAPQSQQFYAVLAMPSEPILVSPGPSIPCSAASTALGCTPRRLPSIPRPGSLSLRPA